jgi:hypothetical protein
MAFKRGADEDGSRDDHLPFLTRPQARRVRMLMRQGMAERGREVAVSGGHVQDDHGTIFSLRNIAAICHNDPRGEKAWPQLVAGYVDKVLAISPEGTARELAGLTAGQVRDHVFAVVVHAASLGPGIASFPSAPEFAPGLLELLALDRPTAGSTSLTMMSPGWAGGRSCSRPAWQICGPCPHRGTSIWTARAGILASSTTSPRTPPAGCSRCLTCSPGSWAPPTPPTGSWPPCHAGTGRTSTSCATAQRGPHSG